MKALLLLALFLSPLAKADPPSVHGMLLFGKDRVYVSHLPMFHAPHDYQLLAELELPPAAVAAYRANVAAHPEETVYTLVPEKLVLPDLVAHPHPFRADLFRGHFERGGSVIAGGLTVKLARVLLFRKFVPGTKRPSQATYLLFGTPGDAYLAHLISARPDFDHVVFAGGNDAVVDGSVVEVHDPARPDTAPLPFPARLDLERTDGTRIFVSPLRELYLETGDLE